MLSHQLHNNKILKDKIKCHFIYIIKENSNIFLETSRRQLVQFTMYINIQEGFYQVH